MSVSRRLRQFAMKNYVAKLQQRARAESVLTKTDREVYGKGIKMKAFQDKEQFKAIKKTVQKGHLEIILEEQGEATHRKDEHPVEREPQNKRAKASIVKQTSSLIHQIRTTMSSAPDEKKKMQAARSEYSRRLREEQLKA